MARPTRDSCRTDVPNGPFARRRAQQVNCVPLPSTPLPVAMTSPSWNDNALPILSLLVRSAICGRASDLRPQTPEAKTPESRPQTSSSMSKSQTEDLNAKAQDPRLQTPGLRPQVPDARPQTPVAKTQDLGLQTSRAKAQNPGLQTAENAALNDKNRRSQASDLRKCCAKRQKRLSQASDLRKRRAKRQHLSSKANDLRPQTCENAAPIAPQPA